ncbi:DUF4760 domain-containing protein [Flavobacterium sp. LBUM151]
MRKILVFITLSIVGIIALIIYVAINFGFSKDNTIALLGYFSIFSSAFLLYFSLDVNLKYNKRRSAMDFLFDRVKKELLPLYIELKGIVNKDFFIESSGRSFKEYLDQEKDDDKKKKAQELANEMLAFYERMALGILKEVYDQDICFDDSAFNMIHFYDWTKTYLEMLQKNYDERSLVNFSHLAEKWHTRYEKQKKDIQKKNNIKDETVANKKI